jgi:hypothetical protein
MKARASLVRRLAFALIAHAANVLPPLRSPWGEAMKHELDHIEGDVEALRWAAGCVIASYLERGGRKMNQSFGKSFGTIVRKPSAFLPLAMSLTALALLGGAYVFALATGQAGLQRQQDEGAIAHLWQLLMAGQLPVLIFFAIRWLPRAPRQTLYVLALQAGAALAAMAPVYFLNL